VICPSCKRWNLSPLEERWDAMDECERLYERTRLRMSTDNIGLARIAEGTELVRVGAALRPELAAWRFGSQLAARRRKYRWLVAGGVVAIGSVYAGIAAAGLSMGAWYNLWQFAERGYERATRTVLPKPVTVEPVKLKDASPEAVAASRKPGVVEARIEASHARGGQVVYDTDRAQLCLRVPIVGKQRAWYTASEVPRVLPKLMAKINRSGGRARDEQMAVQMIERVADVGGPDLPRAVIETYAGKMIRGESWKDEGTLGGLPMPTRLALEMALQEQRERELLAGELLDLETAWREAEELARIADTLAPSHIDAALARLKARLDG